MMKRIKEKGLPPQELSTVGLKTLRDDERGLVLIIVMVLIVALSLLGLAANRNIVTDIGIASNHNASAKAFYSAEGAAEFAFNRIYQDLKTGVNPPASYAVTDMNGFPTRTTVALIGNEIQRPAPDFPGFNAWVKRYRVTGIANPDNPGTKSTVAIDVDKQMIPIFQFLIFYDGDLELNPGSGATIGTRDLVDPKKRGWIHTNGNFYTSPGATETIYTKVTTVGEIHDHRKAGDTQSNGTGTVRIMKGEAGESYQNLTSGSDEANWSTQVAGWKGSVKTGHEGTDRLDLPGLTSMDVLDETGNDEAMGMKAAIKIVDGIAKDRDGNALSTTYVDSNGVTQNSVTEVTFYDYREGKYAKTWTIDVGKFQTTPAGQYLATPTPAKGEAGVLYVKSTASDTASQFNAVRLKNGATLASPFTVATERPLYVQGDYNTVAPKPAAIMSDATTVLSNQWKDSYTNATTLSNRDVTSSMTINVDIMTGNRDTVPIAGQQGYGGGVHNLTRFLENWSGRNFNFGGSLVCMWQSQKVTGRYKNPGTYYNVPGRSFTPDPFNGVMPPGTPKVILVKKRTWRNS